jgi:hypothetical protein
MPNVTAPNLVSFGSPASVIAPDIASQQLTLQRRQQLADVLRQQALAPMEQQTVSGAGPTRVVPFSPLTGVTKMLSAYLVGKNQQDIDSQNLLLNRQYADRMAQLLNDGASTPPQGQSPSPDAASSTPDAASSSTQSAPDAAGAPSGDSAPADAPDSSATLADAGSDASQSVTASPAPQVSNAATAPLVRTISPSESTQPAGQNAFALGKLLRGMAVEQFGGAPAASAYWDQFKLPDTVKMNNYYGLNPADVKAGLENDLASKGLMNVRPGGTLARATPGGGVQGAFTAPDLHTVTNITWQGGQPVANAIPGAAQIQGNLRYAQTAGEGGALPYTGYDAQGRPLPVTSRTAAATQGQAPVPGVPPQAMPPSMPQGIPSAPSGNGSAQPADNDRAAIFQSELGKAQDRYANPQQYMSPADLQQDPNGENFRARAASDIASIQREMQRLPATTSTAPASGGVFGAPQPGYAASQDALATANAKRYGAAIDQAADSPTRVNVYDNILNLSRAGVNSGPGSAWQNQVKGYIANTPFLSSVTNGWRDDVSGFQELNKFMYQNAQRNWQAAGGTGTDAQLEAFTHANPNDRMFPQALQAMAQWGKAGELALQGKTNAMTQWKNQNGGNVANLDQFETTWRKNFDPQLFQLRAMDPQSQSTFVANLKATHPKAYQSLMAKAAALKQLGGL